MEDVERQEIIARLNNLAWYVRKGYPLEFHEPSPRGRKGRSREALRIITFTVRNVSAFDTIGWDLMKRAMAKRPRTPPA